MQIGGRFNAANVLLYSRSFSSFFVRWDKILPFDYQTVTIRMQK